MTNYISCGSRRVCAIVAGGLFLIVGCGPPVAEQMAPENMPGVEAVNSTDKAIMARSLRTARLLPNLQNLLRLNNVSDVSLKKIGTQIRYMNASSPPDVAGAVPVADVIASCGTRFLVAVAVEEIEVAGTGRAVNVEHGVVFTEQGDLLARYGGELLGMNGSYVEFLTLGCKDTWFVRVGLADPDEQLQQLTRIYVLGTTQSIELPVLEVRHHMQNLSYPFAHKSPLRNASDVDGRLRFNGTDDSMEVLQQCSCSDGSAGVPTITWNQDELRFEGLATCEVNGMPLFRVNLDNSLGFFKAPL